MTINLSKCLVQSMKLSRLISFFRTHTNRYKENAISKNIRVTKKKSSMEFIPSFSNPTEQTMYASVNKNCPLSFSIVEKPYLLGWL